MLNGRVMIIHLIARLIKKTLYKTSQYFNLLEEPLMSKLIYLIMQQKQI